jgi:hypothetical protein
MVSTITREQQITAIIAKRQTLAKKLNSIRQYIISLKSAVEEMDQHREEVYNSTSNETIRYRLFNLDLDKIKHSLAVEEQVLNRYYARFNRKTLNIGVIGLARQGKSQLLRSLSGLNDSTIPAGPFGHCTGARSTIIHNPAIDPHGEIHFYTKKEFVEEVLAPYYTELLSTSQHPATLEEFEKNPIPALSPELQQSLSAKIKYAQLELYKTHLQDFKHLLSLPSPHLVPITSVREYVAQDDITGQRSFYNYLAVREARVVCSFPHENVGQVALIDLPGLGDTGLVTEEWLYKTLSNDVDTILFVKKPSGLGEVWKPQEIDLYDAARKVQPELPLDKWAFLVMNHVQSSSPNEDNSRNCERLLEEKSDQMKFADAVIADCSDTQQVNEIILQRVLDYLSETVEDLDTQYLTSLYAGLKALQNQIKGEMNKANDALGVITEATPFNFKVFNRLFKETVRKLYTGFEQEMKALREQRELPNENFYQYVVEAQERSYADTGIPSIEEIEETRNLLGGYKSACEYYFNHSRTHLTRHFETLEEGLNKSVEAIKIQIAEVLREEAYGQLNHLISKTGTPFLSDMTTLLRDQFTVLHPAFDMLARFQVSYQGLFYFRLRRHLDCFTPDTGRAELSAQPTAQEVQDILVAMYKMVLESLKAELENWPIEVNESIFATAEQFVDKVLRTENAMDEWQAFYMENRAKIWPDAFPEPSVSNGMRWQWLEITERVATLSQTIPLNEM